MGDLELCADSRGGEIVDFAVTRDGCLTIRLEFNSSLPRASYNSRMSVQELKRAVTQLEPAELEEFMQWAADDHFKLWDAEIEADLEAGKFDDLLETVRADATAGRVAKRERSSLI
ncbi:MAG: hypothetical protein HC933_07120 [Pleurocapsa sp. SU_196_0]|nr:hypothetical protein [Pleurocapsa sp. SU_196_0]